MTQYDDDALARAWAEQKSDRMVRTLGPMHEMVMHAIIPYALGGGLDLYYYPNGIAGTAIATQELCEVPGKGPSNDVFESYELVMFTRQPLALDDATDPSTPFGKAHHSINAILDHIAPYSEQAKLNPYETCEFPQDMKTVGGKCLIFDAYGADDDPTDFGLMLLMEIHRSEMEFAQQHGGSELIDKLKTAGYYPYSDLDRPPVV